MKEHVFSADKYTVMCNYGTGINIIFPKEIEWNDILSYLKEVLNSSDVKLIDL